MSGEMTDDDVDGAARALLRWIETQDISPDDAGRVLTTSLVALIRGLATTRGLNAKDGGRVIADIIVAGLS